MGNCVIDSKVSANSEISKRVDLSFLAKGKGKGFPVIFRAGAKREEKYGFVHS